MTTIVIPAREKSTRLPEKLLLTVKGKPVIRWTVENCLNVKGINKVVVATDSERIKDALKDLNVDVFLTPSTLKSGSDRISYILDEIDDEDIINVQGDEPLLNPKDLENLAQVLKDEDIVSMYHPIKSEEEFLNPNVVKVVLDKNEYALYFSRSPIPYPRDNFFNRYIKHVFNKHIGVYGYKKEILKKFSSELKHAPIEDIEKLEQLRFLYYGYSIKMVKASSDTLGIDTQEDFEKFKNIIEGRR